MNWAQLLTERGKGAIDHMCELCNGWASCSSSQGLISAPLQCKPQFYYSFCNMIFTEYQIKPSASVYFFSKGKDHRLKQKQLLGLLNFYHRFVCSTRNSKCCSYLVFSQLLVLSQAVGEYVASYFLNLKRYEWSFWHWYSWVCII